MHLDARKVLGYDKLKRILFQIYDWWFRSAGVALPLVPVVLLDDPGARVQLVGIGNLHRPDRFE
jgi:hypothetical protein